MPERDPFGPMPIDNNDPTDIVAQIPESIKVLSEEETDKLLKQMEAAIKKARSLDQLKQGLSAVVDIAKKFAPIPL